jgi:hypothetical protein
VCGYQLLYRSGRRKFRPGQIGKVLVLHYERGYWEEIGSAATRLGMSEGAVPALYLESVDWAQQILSGRTEAESRPA